MKVFVVCTQVEVYLSEVKTSFPIVIQVHAFISPSCPLCVQRVCVCGVHVCVCVCVCGVHVCMCVCVCVVHVFVCDVYVCVWCLCACACFVCVCMYSNVAAPTDTCSISVHTSSITPTFSAYLHSTHVSLRNVNQYVCVDLMQLHLKHSSLNMFQHISMFNMLESLSCQFFSFSFLS